MRKNKYRCKKGGVMSLEEIRKGLPLKADGGFSFDPSQLVSILGNNPDAYAPEGNTNPFLNYQQSGAMFPKSREYDNQVDKDYSQSVNNLMKQYPRGSFDNQARFHNGVDTGFDFRNVPDYINTAFTGIANLMQPDYNPTQYNSSLNTLAYGQTDQGDTKVFNRGGKYKKGDGGTIDKPKYDRMAEWNYYSDPLKKALMNKNPDVYDNYTKEIAANRGTDKYNRYYADETAEKYKYNPLSDEEVNNALSSVAPYNGQNPVQRYKQLQQELFGWDYGVAERHDFSGFGLKELFPFQSSSWASKDAEYRPVIQNGKLVVNPKQVAEVPSVAKMLFGGKYRNKKSY